MTNKKRAEHIINILYKSIESSLDPSKREYIFQRLQIEGLDLIENELDNQNFEGYCARTKEERGL